MTIKELVPLDPTELPMCEHEVQAEARRWREQFPKKGIPNHLCPNRASIQINGKNYCKKHGGMVAIRVLLEQEKQK